MSYQSIGGCLDQGIIASAPSCLPVPSGQQVCNLVLHPILLRGSIGGPQLPNLTLTDTETLIDGPLTSLDLTVNQSRELTFVAGINVTACKWVTVLIAVVMHRGQSNVSHTDVATVSVIAIIAEEKQRLVRGIVAR